jgi:hypothetical protein
MRSEWHVNHTSHPWVTVLEWMVPIACGNFATSAKNRNTFFLKFLPINVRGCEDFSALCLQTNRIRSPIVSVTKVFWKFNIYIFTVCVFVCHMFSFHPFYFDFHSARVIFDVSSGFYFWNVNRNPTWHLSKMFKVAFKNVS